MVADYLNCLTGAGAIARYRAIAPATCVTLNDSYFAVSVSQARLASASVIVELLAFCFAMQSFSLALSELE